MKTVERVTAAVGFVFTIALIAGCGGVSGGPTEMYRGGPLSVDELFQLGDGLEADGVVEVQIEDLNEETREMFSDLVESAAASDGTIRVAANSHSHGLEPRGGRRCYSSVVYTAHRPGCNGTVDKTYRRTRFYSGCPHPGYVTKNPGLLVTGRCSDSRCEYIAKYAYAYHKRS